MPECRTAGRAGVAAHAAQGWEDLQPGGGGKAPARLGGRLGGGGEALGRHALVHFDGVRHPQAAQEQHLHVPPEAQI